MRKRSGLALLPVALALVIPAALAIPVLAIAGAGSASAAGGRAGSDGGGGGEETRDPNNITGISRWMELCVEGNGKYMARDFPGAIGSYRNAVQLAPKNPFPHYLLAEAQLASGNMSEAEASLKQAELLSDKRDALLRAKILFVLADLRERQHKWEEAKAGWQLYTEWAIGQVDGGSYPLSASARVKAIDEVIKLDKATQVVRERIAATANGGFGGPASPPADAGTKTAPPRK